MKPYIIINMYNMRILTIRRRPFKNLRLILSHPHGGTLPTTHHHVKLKPKESKRNGDSFSPHKTTTSFQFHHFLFLISKNTSWMMPVSIWNLNCFCCSCIILMHNFLNTLSHCNFFTCVSSFTQARVLLGKASTMFAF